MSKKGLKLECLAIGSLPHKNVEDAMKLVKSVFKKVPYWPQLAHVNRNEDMTLQVLQGFPGLEKKEDDGSIFVNNESDAFFEQLEELFVDYEEIMAGNDDLLEKYAIKDECSSTFLPFLKIVEETKPNFAKGQVVGPFTLATSLNDLSGRCVYYDETLREIVSKLLSLKVLWQMKNIKKVSPDTTPIIFIDEPSISQLGTSAFITISTEEVVSILKELSEIIQNAGGLSAIHCCGKCDWSIPIASCVDLINLDAFSFAQNLSLFAGDVEKFLKNDGFLTFGVVPTLDKDALIKTDIDEMMNKFDSAVSYLVEKGIDKDLILNHCNVSTSCGAGSLDVELAEKAIKLTGELSLRLKEKYID